MYPYSIGMDYTTSKSKFRNKKLLLQIVNTTLIPIIFSINAMSQWFGGLKGICRVNDFRFPYFEPISMP